MPDNQTVNQPAVQPAVQPTQQTAPAELNPMLDRSLAPGNQPEPSDAHLGGNTEYNDLPEHVLKARQQGNPEEPAEPDYEAPEPVEASHAENLTDMIGQELMQDPGTSLIAQSLIRMMQGKADHNRAFARAIHEGDARFIDEHYLRETLGDDADEAIKAASYLLDYASTYADQMRERLYSSVQGGEQAVQLAARHFRETATPTEQKAITRMLDSGDFELMQYAVQTLVDRAKGIMPAQHQQMHVTPSAVEPLTREEFGRMVLNNPGMSEQQYEALRTRLAAGLRR